MNDPAWISIGVSLATSLFTSGMITGRVLSKMKEMENRLSRIESLFTLVLIPGAVSKEQKKD
jgi:hypothetical protein